VRRALALVALCAAACSTTGRELDPPATRPTPNLGSVAAANLSEGAGGFSITSPAFAAGGALPPDAGEVAGNVSPALQWRNVPAGAAELALVATDAATGDIRWLVLGITAQSAAIPAGTTPPGGRVLPNSRGQSGWHGPAAAPGAKSQVVFTLYALPVAFTPPLGADARRVVDLVAAASATRATVSGWFLGDGATLQG
jgi:hypothetical protein